MGMGIFAKPSGKSGSAARTSQRVEDGPGDGGPSSTQESGSKGAAEKEDDDKHIRFTIGGVGKRMTKEAFIKEMQKLDKTTRHEVIETSNAPHGVKALAKQEPQPQTGEYPGQPSISKSAQSPETEVERRRRLAVLEGVGDVSEDPAESPSELQQTEAAVEVGSAVAEMDSNDGDVCQGWLSRRSIQFVDIPRGRNTRK